MTESSMVEEDFWQVGSFPGDQVSVCRQFPQDQIPLVDGAIEMNYTFHNTYTDRVVVQINSYLTLEELHTAVESAIKPTGWYRTQALTENGDASYAVYDYANDQGGELSVWYDKRGDGHGNADDHRIAIFQYCLIPGCFADR